MATNAIVNAMLGLMPPGEPLVLPEDGTVCEDEGCPHFGTLHTHT